MVKECIEGITRDALVKMYFAGIKRVIDTIQCNYWDELNQCIEISKKDWDRLNRDLSE